MVIELLSIVHLECSISPHPTVVPDILACCPTALTSRAGYANPHETNGAIRLLTCSPGPEIEKYSPT
jgi:hypothetical protein